MKISNLIHLLSELMNAEGDLEVSVTFEVDLGVFQEGSIVKVSRNSKNEAELEVS